MLGKKVELKEVIASNWPYRILNLLPRNWLQRYLIHKSGFNQKKDNSFSFKELQKARKCLLFLPKEQSQLAISLSFIEFLKRTQPKMRIYALCQDIYRDFFRGFFPDIKTFLISANGTFIDNDSFYNLKSSLCNLNVDFTFDFNSMPGLLSSYLQLSTHAPIRIGFKENAYPFNNLIFKPHNGHNIIRMYQSAASLFEDNVHFLDFLKIVPHEDMEKDVKAEWRALKLEQTPTLLYLWDNDPLLERSQAFILDSLINYFLQHPEGAPAIVLANTSDLLHPSNTPAAFQEKLPCFTNISMGKLFSLICRASLTLSQASALMHLANYCGGKVIGLIQESQKITDPETAVKGFHALYYKTPESIDIPRLAGLIQTPD